MNYKDTLNLPQTDFSMKANLAQKEPCMVQAWNDQSLYERLLAKRQSAKPYVLHDGPPYANGHIHMGHALNKILKDIVIRYRSMNGHYVSYVPGWDCHGLPIEHQVVSELKKNKQHKTPLETRQLCREYAQKFVDLQAEEFKRLGIWGHWDRPYLTMNHSYEAGILEVFANLVDKGYVERGFKPIYWCGHCETALAEAEIEYGQHTSSSVYVRFECHDDWSKWIELDQDCTGAMSLMIWTTTPWTLPSNMAVAVHPDLTYAVVKFNNQMAIMAKNLVEAIMAKEGVESYSICGEILGSRLKGLRYKHPFMGLVEGLSDERAVLLADFVTAEDGTGCVHIAPGHGEDDFHVGQANGLGVFMPVNARAQFTDLVPQWSGQKVFTANPLVIESLQDSGHLYHQENFQHSYPHCWRCRKPVIFRATEQWFINVDANQLRQRVLESTERVQWIPEWGQTRISEMVKNRPNWCISRQRSWGVPIPVFYCASCRTPVVKSDLIRSLAQKVSQHGCDIWYSQDAHQLCNLSACESCGSSEFEKETDILDVWFDSGASHYAVLKQTEGLSFPAQLYLEGSDQHRGWFQSSLFLSMAGLEQEPFESVLTHGFVVDGAGHKMSKSVGNVIAPQTVMEQYGADIIRLFVASSDFSDDIRMSDDIMKQKVDAYRKMRNTCRFMLGNTFDFDPTQDTLSYEELLPIDRWALSRLQRLIEEATTHYQSHHFYRFYRELYQFCTAEMSAFYLDILKDRLYTAGSKSKERLSAQTVMTRIVLTLTQLMAPVLSFTSEELWAYLPEALKEESSVHLTDWPQVDSSLRDNVLEDEWEQIAFVRDEVLKVIEPLRTAKDIGSSLEVAVSLKAPADLMSILDKYRKDLAMIFIVSHVDLAAGDSLMIDVAKLQWPKCVRCWTLSESVGKHHLHSELCQKCCDVLEEIRV